MDIADLKKEIQSNAEWLKLFSQIAEYMLLGSPAALKVASELENSMNSKLGAGTVSQDDIAKCLLPIINPIFDEMDKKRKEAYKNSIATYCRMDEDEFYSLSIKRQEALQHEWGRKLYLVAENVNTMEECDLDPNFLGDGRGDVYDIFVEWKNRRTGKDWKGCTEYADLYIYATEDEIKRYMASFENEKGLCLDWFGPYYVLAKY